LTPHSPAVEMAARHRRLSDRTAVDNPAAPCTARVTPSPPVPDNRERRGQVLLLSRTMLGNQELPYVGRFACDWLRLATTDPDTIHALKRTPPHPDCLGRFGR